MSISRIYRLLRLITLLQAGRDYTADELAEELEVSRRTVFRDLNMLEMAHITYYFDEQRKGYRINRHFFLPPINLTLSEALAVLVLSGGLKGEAGKLPLLSHGARAAVKLERALPEAIRKHVGSIIDRVGIKLGPVARYEDGDDEIFDDLAEAISARRICRLEYNSFHDKELITTQVRPLRVIFISRAWYLIAHSSMHSEIRTFKLGRIKKLSVTRKQFETPDDVDLDDYFGDAWSMIPEGRNYDVHLRFAPKVAGNVAEVQWHKSQETELNDDGTLDFRVNVDGLNEITWWLLGYGDQVEVIAPAKLRKSVAKVARAVLDKYGKDGQ